MAIRPQRIFADNEMTRGAHKVYPHFWTTFGYRTGPVYLATIHSQTYWPIFYHTTNEMVETFQPLLDILLIGIARDMVTVSPYSRQWVHDNWYAYQKAWQKGINMASREMLTTAQNPAQTHFVYP